jgi:hypothetical protein
MIGFLAEKKKPGQPRRLFLQAARFLNALRDWGPMGTQLILSFCKSRSEYECATFPYSPVYRHLDREVGQLSARCYLDLSEFLHTLGLAKKQSLISGKTAL